MHAPPLLLVSVHDVAPATIDAVRRWTGFLDERDVVSTLLAVPGPWRGTVLADDPTTTDWLSVRVDGGDEVGLHGWAHRADGSRRGARARVGRCIARGAEEFWALDGDEATRRVRDGLEELGRAGLHPVGFTPPGWLISGPARRAVLRSGLRYVADHRGARSATTTLRAPALGHRPGGFSQTAGTFAMPMVARRRAAEGLPVRIALHPADLDHPKLVASTLDAIDAVLDAGGRATTYGAAVGAWVDA